MLESLFHISLENILPHSLLRDKKFLALARSLDLQLNLLSSEIELVLHLPRLDYLPSDVLDHLAVQYHVDFYQTNFSDKVKRQLIRETIFWHRIKGTPAGVEKAVSTFMVNATVEENWQYGGKPYFFRIITKGLKYLTDEDDFLRLVYESKNTRSWLEEIIFDLTMEEPQTLYAACHELDWGDVVHDPAMPILDQAQDFFVYIFDLSAGEVVHDFCETLPSANQNLYFAVEENIAGDVFTDSADKSDTDDFFLRLIRKKWRNWKKNPIIKFYSHFFQEDDFDPDEPDDFPDADFLRLYFKFPNNTQRHLTFLNPKEDISAQEINALGNYAVENNVLLNKRGQPSSGIFRAVLIKNFIEKVF